MERASRARHGAAVRRAIAPSAVESYLAGLPQGLSSHPEVVAKASLLRIMIDGLPPGFDPAQIPEDVRGLVRTPPPVSSWVPEVHINVVHLAVLDQCFDEDWAWHAWTGRLLDEMMNSPLYRMLFTLMSPRRLTQGGDRRWAAVRRGVQRETLDATEGGFLARFSFPQGLFDRRLAHAQVLALQLAYRHTAAKFATARLEQLTAHEALIRVDYRLGAPADSLADGTELAQRARATR